LLKGGLSPDIELYLNKYYFSFFECQKYCRIRKREFGTNLIETKKMLTLIVVMTTETLALK